MIYITITRSISSLPLIMNMSLVLFETRDDSPKALTHDNSLTRLSVKVPELEPYDLFASFRFAKRLTRSVDLYFFFGWPLC